MNNGDLTGLILLDLQKTFDLVHNELLLKRLSMYRVSEQSLIWFRCYLTERQQGLKYKQSVSELQHVMSGMHQSSILGPLLFIIYINDIALEHEDTELVMYADDSTEYATGKTMTILEEKLKADTDKIVMWCDENRMATNDQKTKSMLITTYHNIYKLSIKQLHVFI